MGITYIKATIRNPEKPTRSVEEEFLVDSGAYFTVLPEAELKKIGIKPHRKQEFMLADGTKLERELGDAIFEYAGVKGAAPIIFGKKGDQKLFGAITLEVLGLVLDPFQRKLRPMKLLMV